MVHAIGVTEPRRLPPTHREAIRALFLQRKREYTAHEAAQLLRLTLGEFHHLVTTGAIEVERRRKRRQLGGPRHLLVSWQEVASAALVRWTVVQIHDALGKDARRVLPPLLRPMQLQPARLPAYQVRLLEALATHRGVTVEEFLYTSLLALETTYTVDEIERLLPGFKEAMAFPNG